MLVGDLTVLKSAPHVGLYSYINISLILRMEQNTRNMKLSTFTKLLITTYWDSFIYSYLSSKLMSTFRQKLWPFQGYKVQLNGELPIKISAYRSPRSLQVKTEIDETIFSRIVNSYWARRRTVITKKMNKRMYWLLGKNSIIGFWLWSNRVEPLRGLYIWL